MVNGVHSRYTNFLEIFKNLKSKFILNYDIYKSTWFQAGGKVDIFCLVTDENELKLILENIKEYDQIYNPVKNLGPAYISWQVVLGFVSAVIWPTAITRALSIKEVKLVKMQYIWSSL